MGNRVDVPLKDFAPDLDQNTPGYLTIYNSNALLHSAVPFSNGWGMLPGFVSIGASALPEASQGAAVLVLTGGNFRVIVGSATKLSEYAGTTITDRSRGGGYTTNTNRWSFAAYGDIVYATNKVDAMQKSTGGNFADVTTIPKASFVDRALDFLIIAGTNESIFGDQADRWWCSALGNPDDFVRSVATQSASGRLTDTGGPITASKSLGDDWAIYKQTSLYLGRYQGPPFIWEFTRVSDTVGTWGQGCVCKVGFAHFFFGYDDFYVFDGTIPQPIPNRLKDFVFSGLDKDNAYKISSYYDRYQSIVYWLYPTVYSSSDLTGIVCYNLRTQQWGHMLLNAPDGITTSLETLVEFITGGMTYDEFYPPTGSTTWNDVPAIPYDSPFFNGNQTVMGVLNSSHELGTLTGSLGLKNLTLSTAFVGDDTLYSTLRRSTPRMVASTGAQADVAHYGKYESGEEPAQLAVSLVTTNGPKRADFMESARWHGVSWSFVETSAAARVTGMVFDIEEDGEE